MGNNRYSRRMYLTYGLPIVWAFFILFATIANTSTLEELSLQDLFQYDKPIHAFLFGMQAWLLIRARSIRAYPSYPKIVWMYSFLAAGYGFFTEILQGWLTTSRTFDYYDVIADCIGCLAVASILLVKRKIVAQ